jgi:hypothetical protein
MHSLMDLQIVEGDDVTYIKGNLQLNPCDDTLIPEPSTICFCLYVAEERCSYVGLSIT